MVRGYLFKKSDRRSGCQIKGGHLILDSEPEAKDLLLPGEGGRRWVEAHSYEEGVGVVGKQQASPAKRI